MEKKGKFIVLYGANNLGKSLQLDLLQKALEKRGIVVQRIKYPIYDLEPTGSKINAVLRLGEKMDELELQKLYVQNRKDFEQTLISLLDKGIWVIAEDYKGTGIAWGMIRGVSLDKLEEINRGLLDEDLALIIHGERFKTGIESTHRNENDDSIWEAAQNNHLMLANKYNWQKVNANRTPDEVHKNIIQILADKGFLNV